MFVSEPYYVTWLSFFGSEGLDCIFQPLMAEVAQERIAGAEREKAEGRAPTTFSIRKKAVDDFVGSAVAANRNKVALPTGVSLARNLGGVTGIVGPDNIDSDARRAKPIPSKYP